MLTVLLATHNGADTLGRTLDAFCRLDQPQYGWQLLLVNNASSDGTEDIALSYVDRLPIKYLVEPRLGKCIALNTGIGNASGDFIVFVDDDVIPAKDFLMQWHDVADSLLEHSVFGGQIIPQFEVPAPDWVAQIDWIMLLYGATRPGQPAGEPSAVESADIFGGNMAIRASALANGCRFDERLMVGQNSLMSDETELIARLVASGCRMWFAPGPLVYHIITAEQVTWRWIMHRFFRHGRTMYFIETQERTLEARRLFGVPRYLIRRIFARTMRLLWAYVTHGRPTTVTLGRLIAYDLGAAYQARLMSVDLGSNAGAVQTAHDLPDCRR